MKKNTALVAVALVAFMLAGITSALADAAPFSEAHNARSGVSSVNLINATDPSLFRSVTGSLFGNCFVNMVRAIGARNVKAGKLHGYAIPAPTPEPGTIALFGTALVGLGIIARRRQKAVPLR